MAASDPAPVWPLLDVPVKFAPDSFMRPRFDRQTGRERFHAGMDLKAPEGTWVVAPEAGTVIKTQTFNGPRAHALLLATEKNGLVLNLGEVEPDSWLDFGVEPGIFVLKGQPVARVGVNPRGDTMLHFEAYVPGTRKTSSWYADQGPPPTLLDPTDYILRAAGRPVSSDTSTPPPPPPVAPPRPPAAPQPGPVVAQAGGGLVAAAAALTAAFLWRRRRRRK